jgi:hypothetical protein
MSIYYMDYYNKYSELFNGERLHELQEEAYYAVVDSQEQVNNTLFVRFDCILAKTADAVRIDKESILSLPSIVIELSGNYAEVRQKLLNDRSYLRDGSWVLLKTKIQQTQFNVQQYFNLNSVANDSKNENYDIESITFYRELTPAEKAKINEIISALSITESSVKAVEAFFHSMRADSIQQVNVYKVGQGNCIGLTDSANIPHAYFDVGNGCNRNTHTFISTFKLCLSTMPAIILSHWDQDHFETAMYDPQSWDCKWLAPMQNLTNTAYRLANKLISNGNLTIWPSTLTFHDFAGNRIVKCTSAMKYKNNSGLALFVNYQDANFVLLPGDATFSKIPHHPTGDIIGLVASHHGSRGAIFGMPSACTPHMLAYSYGANNKEGHVDTPSRSAYSTKGWIQVKETVNGNISMIQNPATLDTPCGNTPNMICSLQIATGQHF